MKKGDKVHWKWGNSEAEGTIEEKFMEPVKKVIKGTEIKRNATKEDPAYLVIQQDGDKVLKLESELKRGNKE